MSETTCEYCGADYEDPGEGFVRHMRESPACREAWEHTADTLAEEWSRR